jgi:hypothetical protein
MVSCNSDKGAESLYIASGIGIAFDSKDTKSRRLGTGGGLEEAALEEEQ